MKVQLWAAYNPNFQECVGVLYVTKEIAEACRTYSDAQLVLPVEIEVPDVLPEVGSVWRSRWGLRVQCHVVGFTSNGKVVMEWPSEAVTAHTPDEFYEQYERIKDGAR